MSNKKDLTRIEDMGEFIHELSLDEEVLPDLPVDEEESPALDFGTVEEASDFTEDAFTTAFDTENLVQETFEGTQAFETENSIDFGSEEFKLEEEPIEETPFFGESLAEEEPVIEVEPEPEPLFVKEEISEFKAPETFEDLKKFSENSSFTGMATEGNPSFSVLVKNVRYIEDVQDIVTLLKELTLLVDSEEQTKSRLMRGNLLIPRISEYAAIFLAHKLRRFDIDILVGLSDEIHPPKHAERPETGIVSKHNLYQNQNHHFQFDDSRIELSQIIVAATPTLEGYQVVRYMGVASEHKMLDSQSVEDETNAEIPVHYQELAQKLKAHALKNHSNAVVGLNYQLTPIPGEFGMSGYKYRLTCTGNLVWVNKV